MMEKRAIKFNINAIGNSAPFGADKTIVYAHEVNDEIVKILNDKHSKNLLTFDDCLYTQYMYRNQIDNRNRIYFLCPTLLNNSNIQNKEYITCYDAMRKHFFDNDNSSYMTLNNIKELIDEGYTIGAHSYFHANLKYKFNKVYNISYSPLCNDNSDYAIKDTELLVEWFDKNLGYVPKQYCFPFNQCTDKLIELLKRYGFTEFYGNNRIEIYCT